MDTTDRPLLGSVQDTVAQIQTVLFAAAVVLAFTIFDARSGDADRTPAPAPAPAPAAATAPVIRASLALPVDHDGPDACLRTVATAAARD